MSGIILDFNSDSELILINQTDPYSGVHWLNKSGRKQSNQAKMRVMVRRKGGKRRSGRRPHPRPRRGQQVVRQRYL